MTAPPVQHPLDVTRARHETPGCTTVLHLNNAGASLMPQAVSRALVEYIQEEAQYGGYEAADNHEGDLEATYGALAQLIHGHPHEIAFIENATRAWDMAFYAIPFKPGDRILTAVSEYASNYIAYLQIAEKYGVSVETIPNEPNGQLSVEALKAMMDERVKLVSITHIPTNNGLVNPAEAVGQVVQNEDCLYLLDACQSVGQYPIDVKAIGCHMLSATGRKYLRGPRGTGFLYVNERLIETLTPPMLDLHAAEWVAPNRYKIRPDAKRFENWECNFAGKYALGIAAQYAQSWGIDTIWQRVQHLAQILRQGLQEIPGITVQDLGAVQCGITTFTAEQLPPEAIAKALKGRHINVSYSPKQYTLLDMEQRGLESVVRASVHYYNTEEEIEEFLTALRQTLSA